MPLAVSSPSPTLDLATLGDARGFLQAYAEQFQTLCQQTAAWIGDLAVVRDLLMEASQRGKKTLVVGNGGSAAIASHVAVDLTKNAKIRAINFNEADLITCFANDYGYEQWMAQAVAAYGEPGDVLIAVSSSGCSKNILNACRAAARLEIPVVTFSGFAPDNPLRQLGRHNFWVESRAYNLIEMVHQFWLLALVDLIIGRAEYPASPPA